MVIDSSALLAILLDEPERSIFTARIDTADIRLASTATLLETSMVVLARLGDKGGVELESLLRVAEVEPNPFTAEQLRVAIGAFRRFGRGRHGGGPHPARLQDGLQGHARRRASRPRWPSSPWDAASPCWPTRSCARISCSRTAISSNLPNTSRRPDAVKATTIILDRPYSRQRRHRWGTSLTDFEPAQAFGRWIPELRQWSAWSGMTVRHCPATAVIPGVHRSNDPIHGRGRPIRKARSPVGSDRVQPG